MLCHFQHIFGFKTDRGIRIAFRLTCSSVSVYFDDQSFILRQMKDNSTTISAFSTAQKFRPRRYRCLQVMSKSMGETGPVRTVSLLQDTPQRLPRSPSTLTTFTYALAVKS